MSSIHVVLFLTVRFPLSSSPRDKIIMYPDFIPSIWDQPWAWMSRTTPPKKDSPSIQELSVAWTPLPVSTITDGGIWIYNLAFFDLIALILPAFDLAAKIRTWWVGSANASSMLRSPSEPFECTLCPFANHKTSHLTAQLANISNGGWLGNRKFFNNGSKVD